MKETIKTTVELPRELYRRVKAKSAIEGLHVREVTIALYEKWLGEIESNNGTKEQSWWLDELMDLTIHEPPSGETAREIISIDRDRLKGSIGDDNG